MKPRVHRRSGAPPACPVVKVAPGRQLFLNPDISGVDAAEM
jgi:hypothetical protein